MLSYLWSFLLSWIKQCLSIPKREVKLFVFSDSYYDAGVRIVNSGSFPVALLQLVAESKTKKEVVEEWRNLFLGPGEKKEIFLDLREEIFYEICRLYVISAENKEFYLSKKECSKIKQTALYIHRDN